MDGRGQTMEVRGIKLYYEIRGEDRAVPLVLLHGGGDTIQTSFGKVIEGLARIRRVIAFEQQGQGHTTDRDEPFSFESTAEDTVALLRGMKIERADFLGFSNGGHVALVLGQRHPELVRKLIVASAMIRRDGTDPQFWEGLRNATLANMPPVLQEAYLATAPHPEALQSMFEKSRDRMLRFKDWTDADVRAIRAPALVLIGDHDIVRPEHAKEMAGLLSGQLAILPGEHMTLFDQADVIVPLVNRFLDAPAAAPR